jgi:hypothetical protein
LVTVLQNVASLSSLFKQPNVVWLNV